MLREKPRSQREHKAGTGGSPCGFTSAGVSVVPVIHSRDAAFFISSESRNEAMAVRPLRPVSSPLLSACSAALQRALTDNLQSETADGTRLFCGLGLELQVHGQTQTHRSRRTNQYTPTPCCIWYSPTYNNTGPGLPRNEDGGGEVGCRWEQTGVHELPGGGGRKVLTQHTKLSVSRAAGRDRRNRVVRNLHVSLKKIRIERHQSGFI